VAPPPRLADDRRIPRLARFGRRGVSRRGTARRTPGPVGSALRVRRYRGRRTRVAVDSGRRSRAPRCSTRVPGLECHRIVRHSGGRRRRRSHRDVRSAGDGRAFPTPTRRHSALACTADYCFSRSAIRASSTAGPSTIARISPPPQRMIARASPGVMPACSRMACTKCEWLEKPSAWATRDNDAGPG